jgi:hypothetical protein
MENGLKIRQTWKDAFCNHVLGFEVVPGADVTTGYKIIWLLWSADIWYGGLLPFRLMFPLLKFLILCNIIVWIILFMWR